MYFHDSDCVIAAMTICNIQTKKNVQWNHIGTLIPKQQLKQLPQQRHLTDHPNDGGGRPPVDEVVVVVTVVVVVVVVLGEDDGEVY